MSRDCVLASSRKGNYVWREPGVYHFGHCGGMTLCGPYIARWWSLSLTLLLPWGWVEDSEYIIEEKLDVEHTRLKVLKYIWWPPIRLFPSFIDCGAFPVAYTITVRKISTDVDKIPSKHNRIVVVPVKTVASRQGSIECCAVDGLPYSLWCGFNGWFGRDCPSSLAVVSLTIISHPTMVSLRQLSWPRLLRLRKP